MIIQMTRQLLEDYEVWLREQGLKWPQNLTCPARIFLRWMSAQGLSLAQLSPRQLNDFLCWRKARTRKYVTLYHGWHRLRRFLRYLAVQNLAPGGLDNAVSCRWLDVPGGLPGYRGVMRQLFVRTFSMRRYRLPLFEPHLENHISSLLKRGYSKATIMQVLTHTYRFHEFLSRKRVGSLSQVSPALLKSFIRQERVRFRRKRGRAPSEFHIYVVAVYVERFLVYAWAQRGKSFHRIKPASESRLLSEGLIGRYLDFCRSDRGLKPATVQSHRQGLIRLRSFLESRGIRKLQAVTAADLQDFCLQLSRTRTAPGMAGALGPIRHFFRYLHVDGRIESDPARGLVSPCRYRAARRPKYLPWRKVEQLLAGVDRSSAVGKRDYAILVLLACHGLRAREVAGLRIPDLDLDAPALLLRERKGGKAARIPLSRRTQKALQDYLVVRPASVRDEVFLTVQAPIHPLGRHLWQVAWRRLEARFGRSLSSHGSYVLRHSFAKAMLDRGARLTDIGTLLGHRCLSSTLTYTRVATEELREVADNYAEFL